ncbi:MAG: DUF1580 domain-containing protein [Candidatus Hydrogenedentes bacterium]|nr:DUF1580 domain-containing protein [Candidatus Hydrogenedentota bacterium]
MQCLECLIPLTEAAKRLPGRPALSTVWRWATKGQNGIRLETRRYGRKWFTSAEALDDFARALAARSIEKLDRPAAPAQAKPKARSAAKRQRDIEAARAVLRAEGVIR